MKFTSLQDSWVLYDPDLKPCGCGWAPGLSEIGEGGSGCVQADRLGLPRVKEGQEPSVG